MSPNSSDMGQNHTHIINSQETVLITGASGFIGSRVLEALISRGFRSIRCFVRPGSDQRRLRELGSAVPDAHIDFFKGNLLSPADCSAAMKGVAIVLHLAT